MMGSVGSGDSALAAFAALLQASSDPNTRADWLARVTAETVKADKLAKQVTQTNIETETKRAEVETHHKAISEKLARIEALERDIASREQQYQRNLYTLKSSNDKLTQDAAALRERTTQADADIKKRYAELEKAKSDHAEFVEAQKMSFAAKLDDINRTAAQRMAEVQKINDRAADLKDEAAKVHAKALELKAQHEKNIASLNEFLKGIMK